MTIVAAHGALAQASKAAHETGLEAWAASALHERRLGGVEAGAAIPTILRFLEILSGLHAELGKLRVQGRTGPWQEMPAPSAWEQFGLGTGVVDNAQVPAAAGAWAAARSGCSLEIHVAMEKLARNLAARTSRSQALAVGGLPEGASAQSAAGDSRGGGDCGRWRCGASWWRRGGP